MAAKKRRVKRGRPYASDPKSGRIDWFRAEQARIDKWHEAHARARAKNPELSFSAWMRTALDTAAARELGR